MEAKQILDNMTPTPWYPVDYSGKHILQKEDFYVMDDDVLNEEMNNSASVNVLAAAIAVNTTYGKGLNPEAYEDVVKALHWCINKLVGHMYDSEVNNILKTIDKARI